MNPDPSSQSSHLFEALGSENNQLGEYLYALDRETTERLSKPSAEALNMMEHNITGLLGQLPPEHFGMTVTTNREQLGRLLASAMMTGYFLHKAETRMNLENQL
ncbi:DUF760 domain-containing protein [Roseofilum casamattae]|uniref:DUF760 domain-containing protein n=1 Tax=Roseofilum casamattae BLCC-M143 TaxID=3022442 RepID=A0ABT7C345_9CYAN|nr:DUF760 domain-containing protein [Roseofilum casamattae]MDJ1185845.1 DUF760 domain-containing protein [Roseofilum casamattae BLCC-M143]